MTLVIMAAGMGSRFGGLKQVEPVGPNGEFILDYSVYDAINIQAAAMRDKTRHSVFNGYNRPT